MRKEELENLKIGDIVSISAHSSRNYGKRGMVTEIGTIWEGRGTTGIFLKPLGCEFEFGKGYTLTKREKETNTYMYRHTALKIENPEKDNKNTILMKMFNLPIQESAYLYVPFNNQLKVYEGCIRMNCYMNGICITKTETIKCSDEPKVVYNNVVWLAERDDNLARAIFIQYEEAEIIILKEQIETKSNMIQNLKGEIVL